MGFTGATVGQADPAPPLVYVVLIPGGSERWHFKSTRCVYNKAPKWSSRFEIKHSDHNVMVFILFYYYGSLAFVVEHEDVIGANGFM